MILKALKILPVVIGSFSVKQPILDTPKKADNTPQATYTYNTWEVVNYDHYTFNEEDTNYYTYISAYRGDSQDVYENPNAKYEIFYYQQNQYYEDAHFKYLTTNKNIENQNIPSNERHNPKAMFVNKITNLRGQNTLLEQFNYASALDTLYIPATTPRNWNRNVKKYIAVDTNQQHDYVAYLNPDNQTLDDLQLEIEQDNTFILLSNETYEYTQAVNDGTIKYWTNSLNGTTEYTLNANYNYYIVIIVEFTTQDVARVRYRNHERETDEFILPLNTSNFPIATEVTQKLYQVYVVQEVIDMPDLMFDVLTMPFTFISIAFNLTLWPNTPYQINISNLFFVLIAVFVFAFVMKIILGKLL